MVFVLPVLVLSSPRSRCTDAATADYDKCQADADKAYDRQNVNINNRYARCTNQLTNSEWSNCISAAIAKCNGQDESCIIFELAKCRDSILPECERVKEEDTAANVQTLSRARSECSAALSARITACTNDQCEPGFPADCSGGQVCTGGVCQSPPSCDGDIPFCDGSGATCGADGLWTCGPGSPILIDVNHDGFNLTSGSSGVVFDLNGDGKSVGRKPARTMRG